MAMYSACVGHGGAPGWQDQGRQGASCHVGFPFLLLSHVIRRKREGWAGEPWLLLLVNEMLGEEGSRTELMRCDSREGLTVLGVG